MKTSILLITLAGLMLSLTGCATPADPTYEPAADRGVVVFTVTQEKSPAATGREKIDFIFSGGALGHSRIVASSRSEWEDSSAPIFDKAYGRVYALSFPAGINQLNHWSMNNYFRDFYPDGTLPPLKFEVKPGSVTYIGNLHSRLRFDKNLFGSSIVSGALTQIRDESGRDLALILQQYPQFAGKIIAAPLRPGPWLPE